MFTTGFRHVGIRCGALRFFCVCVSVWSAFFVSFLSFLFAEEKSTWLRRSRSVLLLAGEAGEVVVDRAAVLVGRCFCLGENNERRTTWSARNNDMLTAEQRHE